MKKLKLLISSAVITLAFLAPQKLWGMENPDPVDHRTVSKIVTKHLTDNPGLLDSSKDKDIVVVLGNTGAGKSTLINYLSRQRLKVNDLDDIVLEDPNDPSAMAIGGGSASETFLPACVQVGNLLFYDLPGFKDTRGTAKSLVNAAFIKRIIENARSAKLVFVAGIDQITSDRGASFKTLLSQAKQLLRNCMEPIENFSSLVITKSQINRAKLPDFLKTKVDLLDPDFEILECLIGDKKVAQMSRPVNSMIGSEDRDDILKLISGIGHAKLGTIDIGVIYDTSQRLEIKKIYDSEIEDIIENLFSQHVDMKNLSALDKATLESKRDNLQNKFNSQVFLSLYKSSLITLLRPISETLYQSSWSDKNKTLAIRLANIISQINVEIKEREKQEEERRRLQAEAEKKEEERKRIQAEVALRQAQERARADQERAYKAEQEVRAYRVQEAQRAQEAQRLEQIRKAEEAERAVARAREAEIRRNLERQEESRRLQAEAELRQAQERARADQERAYRAEQEARAYKEVEAREAAQRQEKERAYKEVEAREVAQRQEKERAKAKEADSERNASTPAKARRIIAEHDEYIFGPRGCSAPEHTWEGRGHAVSGRLYKRWEDIKQQYTDEEIRSECPACIGARRYLGY